jgi:ABC-type transport system involved in multi-copper enzyme maturation permease subunit
MINIIRADIYRILHGKAIYITFALAEIILIVFLIGVTSQDSATPAEIYANTWGYTPENAGYDSMGIAASVLYFVTKDTVYYLLALFILTAAPLFSHSTIRNDLSHGVPRTTLYVSKLILSFLLCFAMMFFYIATGMLIAAIMQGVGTAPEGHWLIFLKTCSAQFFMLLALTSVGIFLVFTTKHTAAVIGAFLAFCLIPGVFIESLSSAYPNLRHILDYDIISNITKLAFIEMLETSDLIRILGSGLLYMTVPTAAGIILFKKADIK